MAEVKSPKGFQKDPLGAPTLAEAGIGKLTTKTKAELKAVG